MSGILLVYLIIYPDAAQCFMNMQIISHHRKSTIWQPLKGFNNSTISVSKYRRLISKLLTWDFNILYYVIFCTSQLKIKYCQMSTTTKIYVVFMYSVAKKFKNIYNFHNSLPLNTYSNIAIFINSIFFYKALIL